MRSTSVYALVVLAMITLGAIPANATVCTQHYSSDTEMLALINQTAFVAEGRIGGVTTFELDIGPDTAHPAQTAEFAWQNGAPHNFSVVYNQTLNLVTFTVDTTILQYTPDPLIEITDIFFARTRAVNSDTNILLNTLQLEGEAVNDICFAQGPNGLDILRIWGPDLSDGFILTGQSTMNWLTKPSQSQLAYQIKVGNIVPEPTSMLLLGLGALALLRKRKA